MLIRSGKIQFLFWTAFFSLLLYLWIVTVGLQTFVLPDERPTELPENVIGLMFILYGLLAVSLLIGSIISTMITILYEIFWNYDDNRIGNVISSKRDVRLRIEFFFIPTKSMGRGKGILAST